MGTYGCINYSQILDLPLSYYFTGNILLFSLFKKRFRVCLIPFLLLNLFEGQWRERNKIVRPGKFVCESPGPAYYTVSMHYPQRIFSQTMYAHTCDGPCWFFSIMCSWHILLGETAGHTQHDAFFLTSCYQTLRSTHTAAIYTYLRQWLIIFK